MPTDPKPNRGDRTRAVHAGRTDGPLSTPIVHSATFTAPSLDAMMKEQELGPAGQFYQRYGHPTAHAVEQRFAELEGSERALLFGSGMSAITNALMALIGPGDHVVAIQQCYGGTLEALRWGAERFGWQVTLVDVRAPETWEAAFRPNTRLLHVESPTNPTLFVVDLAGAAGLAHRHGVLLTVDNTFASPVGQRPLDLGADLVMYSATKSIGGHGDLLAGIVSGPAATIDKVQKARKLFGGICDPNTAWLIDRSLSTLPLRVMAANDNALRLAERLATHAGVRKVYYPGLATHPGHDVARRQMKLGFGPVVALDLDDAEQAHRFLDALELFGVAPSLGGVESLAVVPSLTSHIGLSPAERAAAGITEGAVRLAVGIEDPEDLWKDLEGALARCRGARV